MKRNYIIAIGSLLLIATSGGALTQEEQANEYVVVCDVYGPGYYYIPGREICVNVDTGETRFESSEGTVVGTTELAKRVKMLEEALETLKR